MSCEPWIKTAGGTDEVTHWTSDFSRVWQEQKHAARPWGFSQSNPESTLKCSFKSVYEFGESKDRLVNLREPNADGKFPGEIKIRFSAGRRGWREGRHQGKAKHSKYSDVEKNKL